MESCRTCRFAVISLQQCRHSPPTCFPAPTPRGIALVGGFPGLPADGGGCGAHEAADAAEIQRRDVEHPITVREVPDGPRMVTS